MMPAVGTHFPFHTQLIGMPFVSAKSSLGYYMFKVSAIMWQNGAEILFLKIEINLIKL